MQMTLEQWQEKHNKESYAHVKCNNTRCVMIEHEHPGRKELWALTDYRVSSVWGITIWLRSVN